MQCLRCGHLIPDHLLDCPACVEERSKPAIRANQRHPLLLCAQGRGILTTRAIAATRHVQMFGCDRTFCGERIESGHRRGSQSFESLNNVATFICSKCVAEVNAILKEAQACSV